MHRLTQHKAGPVSRKWLQASVVIHIILVVVCLLPEFIVTKKTKPQRKVPIEIQVTTQQSVATAAVSAPSNQTSKKKTPAMAKKIALKSKQVLNTATTASKNSVNKAKITKLKNKKSQASKAKLAMQEQAAKQRLLQKQQLDMAHKQKLAKLAEQEKQKQQAAMAQKKAQEAKRLAKIAEQKQIQQDQYELHEARDILIKHMEQFLLQPKGASEHWQATLEIIVDKLGKVQSVKIVHSSGSALHDRTAVNTVYKAQPLPLPTNQRIKEQFMHFRLNVSPN